MEKKTKKELLIFGGMFVGALLIAAFFFVLPSLLSSFNKTSQVPSFVGGSNYLRLLLGDSVFGAALWNTILPMLIPILTAVLLSGLFYYLIKNEKAYFILTIASLVFAVGSWIFARLFENSGDPYALLNGILLKLHIISEPMSLLSPQLGQAIYWLYAFFNFFVVFAILNLFFLFIRLNQLSGYLRIFAGIGGFFLALLLLASPNELVTALQGMQGMDYSAHTILSHMTDYDQVRVETTGVSAVLSGVFWKLAAAVLIAFLFWCVDKMIVKKSKKSDLAQKPSILPENN